MPHAVTLPDPSTEGRALEIVEPRRSSRSETAEKVAFARGFAGCRTDAVRASFLRRRDGCFVDCAGHAACDAVRMVAREMVQHVIALHRESEIAALRARAQRAERRVDAFLSMAHELRTLLGGVAAPAGALLELAPRGEALTGAQRAHVRLIQRSGADLLDVVDRALAEGALEHGPREEPFDGAQASIRAEFDLRRKIDEVLALASYRADAKGLTVAATVDPNVPLTVVGDCVRVRRAILDLVVNAVTFTNEGSITVRVRRAEPIHAEDRVVIAIDVVDTGVGIPAETLAGLFDAPAREDDGSPRIVHSGLGLSLVRRSVEAMGGVVSCVSEVGRGSWFTIELPLEPGATASPEPLEDPPARERREDPPTLDPVTLASPEGAPASPAIDFEVLQGLGEAAGGADFVVELVDIFSSAVGERGAELRRAVSRGDDQAAFIAVHSLRGMCSQMGANVIAGRFMDLEMLARRSAVAELEALLPGVELELALVIDGLRAWLATRRAAA